MRTLKRLILATIVLGASTALVACGDNSQTCGAGTAPNADGICLPTGDGPDADPSQPDAEVPDANVPPDADTSPTISGTLAVTDVTLIDPTAQVAQVGGSVRGGAIRMSFGDLTMPEHHGGEVVFSGGAGAPIASCLVTRFDATHQPSVRLDGGPITIGAPAAGTSGLLKTVGPCTLQPLLGDPDPYVCISNAATAATVVAQGLGTGPVAYVFAAPTVDFGMTPAATITTAARTTGVVTVTTAAAHGYLPTMNVTVAGVARSATVALTGVTRTGNVVTALAAGHDLDVGNPVTIALVPDTTYNGTFTVATVVAGVSFTYAQTATDAASSVGGTTTLRPYNGRHAITGVTGTTFTYALAGNDDATGTGGTSAVPTQAIAGSVISVNGFANTLYNSGAGAFPVLQQLDANTLVLLNPAGTAQALQQSSTVAYTALNGFSPVPAAGANANFLGRDGSVRIQKAANAVWPAIDFTTDVPGEAPAAVAITTLVRAANVVTATVGGFTAGQRVTIAGSTAATDSFNGTFTIATATATTFTYAQTATAETATAPGTAQKSSFALDTGPATGTASNLLHMFPRVTAAAQNYSCDNNTAADATDDTCGDESTTTLKALIISGSATRRSVAGLFPFQMPTEISGSDTPWLEWQCAYLLNKSADMPTAAVQAILDFQPTRIEQQVLFVAGTLLDDGGVNAGGLRVLIGHALAGHATFSRATGTDGFGVPVSHQCNDGIDNEGTPDTLIDFGFDPDCTTPFDTSE